MLWLWLLSKVVGIFPLKDSHVPVVVEFEAVFVGLCAPPAQHFSAEQLRETCSVQQWILQLRRRDDYWLMASQQTESMHKQKLLSGMPGH